MRAATESHQAIVDDGWDMPDEAAPEVAFAPADQRGSHPAQPITAPPDVLLCPVIDRREASSLLSTTTSKDEVGQTLVDWLRSTLGGGLVLLAKDGSALGWKGFFSSAEPGLIEAIAVSLTTPTMFSLAYDSRAPFVGPPPAGATLQDRFWKLLGCAPPKEVLVAPVVLGKRVVNLLYAHSDGDTPIAASVVDEATALCHEAAEAYKRIVRLSK
jgi:hypothetical protein